MITDKGQIKEAIDYVLSQEMYIRLTLDDFEKACPSPDYAIHVAGRSAAEAVKLFQIDLAIAGQQRLSGLVVYIKSMSMTMRELDMIQQSMPSAGCYKQCMSFAKPDEGETEIVLFAETV